MLVKRIFILLIILYLSFVCIRSVQADSLGDCLKNAKFLSICPFREKLPVGTICKRTGEDIEIVASKDDCLPELKTEPQELACPKRITSSEGALDILAGLSKDLVKTDLEVALKLAAATETYLDFSTLEMEMVPSRHKLVEYMTHMAESSCYEYLYNNDVIHTVVKTKGFTFVLKNAKSGGLEAIFGALVKANIKANKKGTEIITLESEIPFCIAYKAYKGKSLLKEIEKKREEREKEPPKVAYEFYPGPQEVEQDEESLKHFNLWK